MVNIKGCFGRDGKRLNVKIDPKCLVDLERLKDRNQTKFYDSCILVDGLVGEGKSTFAITTIAPILAKSYKNIHVTFEGDELTAKMTDPNTEEEAVLILDESTRSLASGQALTKEFQRIRNVMMLCRQKRYYIIIILPSFFLLNVVFAVFRSNLLYHVRAIDSQRGYFDCYGRDRKCSLYLRGKKMMSYSPSTQKHNYLGRFAINKNLWEHICPDYIERKAKHFQDQAELDSGGTPRDDWANTILENAVSNLQLMGKDPSFPKGAFTIKKIAEICGVGERTINATIKRIKLLNKYPEELYSSSELKKKLRKNALKSIKDTEYPAQEVYFTENLKKSNDEDEEKK